MPLPINQYPGLPRNAIEHFEIQRARRLQLLHTPQPNTHYSAPEHGSQTQSEPQVQPSPADQPWHGAIHYEGLARPQIQPQRDYNAELQRRFEQRHAQRRQRRAGNQPNNEVETPDLPAASGPSDDDDHQVRFNAQFHQHIIRLQDEAEQALQEQQRNQALQAPLADLQYNLAAQQQLRNERIQALANQERGLYEMELVRQQGDAEVHRVQEMELQRRQQEIEAQEAVRRREQEQREHLNDLYQEYGPASAEQHEEDMARNQSANPNPNDAPLPDGAHHDAAPENPNNPNDPLPPDNNAPIPQRHHAAPGNPGDPDDPPPPNQGVPHLNRQPVHPGGRPYEEPIVRNSLGLMNVKCRHCHALHFDCEKLSKSTRISGPLFEICCLEGLVLLPALREWSNVLNHLYEHQSFRDKIRQYNSSLAFTSLGVEVDECTVQGSSPAAFRIHGALYHLMGSLTPAQNQDPSYAQLFIYDPQEATDHRIHCNSNLDRTTLAELHDMLANYHPYVNVYKQAYHIMLEKPPEQHSDLQVQLHFNAGTDG